MYTLHTFRITGHKLIKCRIIKLNTMTHTLAEKALQLHQLSLLSGTR